ncbi:MAG: HAMP domain-containing histidine kinase [Oscillochloris sp.]|nr:HAMP domain-containing histidine kinase [Oscillochloris sp.]
MSLGAYWRGYQWTRYVVLIGVSLGSGLLTIEPYLTQRFSITIFLSPVLALVLADPLWVIIAALTTYGCLLVRSGEADIYSDPVTIWIIMVIIGGMAVARYLTDGAIDRAEEQARLIDKERAHLAERVEERTRELSVANAQLRQANQMKDAFLSSVSHELRTPLNVILGSVELLQEEIYGPLADRQQRALTTVDESGRHLLSLINDILDLAKMEAGKFDFSFDMVSVSDACTQCIRLIRPHAERKGIVVKLEIDSAMDMISSDLQRLRQILLNLLSNAVKFTPEGGTIGLRAWSDQEAGTVDLTVWDTGIGISVVDQELLFQPFMQIDSRLARQYDGTGLGLALVAQLVALHHGRVLVESVPGKGSSFTVRLPISQPILN